jgi:two-component system, cell cycle sensor histidine kinase DivJ
MALLSSAGDYIDGLVHPSLAGEEAVAARHRGFIITHLAGGMLAFAVLPLFLLLRGGPPSLIEMVVLGWLIAPILCALYLSRSGRLERARTLSAIAFGVLVVSIAALSGGVQSVALFCLPGLTLEAFLAGGRKAGVRFAAVATAAVCVLAGAQAAGLLASGGGTGLAALATSCAVAAGAMLHACSLASRFQLQGPVMTSRASDQSRLALLLDDAGDLVVRHDHTGAVIAASAAADRMLGVPAEELAGRGLLERVHVADRPAFLTALSSASQTTSRAVQIRLRQNGSDQVAAPGFLWAELRCRSVGVDDGDRRHGRVVVSIIRDISDRKALEQADAEDVAAVQRAEAAKESFLANVSHELRTPLNAIIGFSELLADQGSRSVDEARRQEYAELIHESGLHLLAVVNGILDVSRLDSGNFSIAREPFELKKVVSSCIQLFELKAKLAGVVVEADIPASLPELPADQRACKQILINLLSNAIKFTPSGGRVRIAASASGGCMRIEVADSGVGIGKDDLPRLGTSFFQVRSALDRPFEGTGLGLSVVKGLVALHEGTFHVDSRLGHGTRVIVELPLHSPSAIEPADAGDVVALPALQRAANG